MPKDTVVVHVTKLAAAQRQLTAAIRMFLQGEDDLAVHTVAAACTRFCVISKGDVDGMKPLIFGNGGCFRLPNTLPRVRFLAFPLMSRSLRR